MSTYVLLTVSVDDGGGAAPCTATALCHHDTRSLSGWRVLCVQPQFPSPSEEWSHVRTSLQTEVEPRCGHRRCLNKQHPQQVPPVPEGLGGGKHSILGSFSPGRKLCAPMTAHHPPFPAATALLRGTTSLAKPGAGLSRQTCQGFPQELSRGVKPLPPPASSHHVDTLNYILFR